MACILSLSFELQMHILSFLDPVHSMCFALACKQLYAIHSTLHKPLPLNAFTYECPISSSDRVGVCHLFTHLEKWKPSDVKYCGGCHKFCLTNNPTGGARGRCNRCLEKEVGKQYFDWILIKRPTQELQDHSDPTGLRRGLHRSCNRPATPIY